MADRKPNRRLINLMALAAVSNGGLAKRVAEVASGHGVEVRYDHVNVKRWRDGVRPRGMTPHFIAEALGRKLGRPVSLAEIGMEAGDGAVLLTADRYAESLVESVRSIGTLVRADLAGSAAAGGAAIDPGAWSDLMVRWLVAPDAVPAEDVPTDSAIAAVTQATTMFAQFDYQFGGGYARSSLVQYVDAEVAPLLRSERHRRSPELLRAAALLLRLTGWTAYDTGHHGLAHRYLTQALRLAQEAGDRALGGRILAGMSHQANFLGHYEHAANLARAAQRGAAGSCTPTMMALFHAMEARALANLGHARSCEQALSKAERWFGQRNPENDPSWMRYFDSAELAAEFAHCYRDLGMAARAVEYAQLAVDSHEPMYVRSISFCRTVLAAGHLGRGDMEEALALADQVLSTTEALRSGRCVEYVRDLVRRLGGFVGQRDVAEFVGRAGGVLSPG